MTRDEVRARVDANLAAEQALRAKGTAAVRADRRRRSKRMVAEASVARVFGYEKALFDFDSKHITRPGNKLASAYLFDTYKSFGYAPEYPVVRARSNALGGQTANVVATLKGTVNPELVYVVSSHYDSVAIGPGADDDTSGTAALLETARILAGHPLPATIVFASFTGEEAGLLGSREFVRRAVADKVKLVGALNNDMIGWANDHRLDNTIRYSNPGIRDIQHARRDAVHEPDHLRRALLQEHRRRGVLRGLRRHRRRHRLVSGARQPALPPVARHAREHEPPADHRGREDDRGDADAARVEPVAPDGSEGRQLHRRHRRRSRGRRARRRASPATSSRTGPPRNPRRSRSRVDAADGHAAGVAAGTRVAVKAVNAKGLEGWDWARAVVK